MHLTKRGMEELALASDERKLYQVGDWVEVGALFEIEMLHRQRRAFQTQDDLVDQNLRVDSSPR